MDTSVKKRQSGQRPKKKKFQGNAFLKKTGKHANQSTCFVSAKPPKSCKSKKLASARTVYEAYQTKASESFLGYRLMDISLLFSAINKVACCSVCYGTLKIKEKSTIGLFSCYEINCENCGKVISFKSCPMIGERKNIPEINRRSVLAMRCIGQGHAGLSTFCSVMSLPVPVTRMAYNSINNKLSTVIHNVAEQSMRNATLEEISLSGYSEGITVSGDGTWKTRGHTSLIGACTLIGADSGKVIDIEVMSSFCKGCDMYKGAKFGSKYRKWLQLHKYSCRKNHYGSAGKMEVDGMKRIFQRSEKERGTKYRQYIGDGDSKTFNAISEQMPYGKDYIIEKVECVGHIQKRMGTRLRKLKTTLGKSKLSDGKTIGGKGRLTDSSINKLTNYYGNAIRGNTASVSDMRTAIWAVWAHTGSSDEEPMHWFCPKGPNSWCKYNIAVYNNVKNYKHKNTMPKAVMEVIKPIFKDLSHPKLLKRCLGGKTQNANESLNSLIWKYSPKVIGSGRNVAEIAAYFATCVFNDGSKAILDVLHALEMNIEKRTILDCINTDKTRLNIAEKRVDDSSLDARRAKRMKKVHETELLMAKEGEIYASGCF